MNKTKRHLYSLITLLFVLGFGIFSYRYLILEVPLSDHDTVNSWMVEANLRFVAEKNVPIKANFNIPFAPPHFAILDEYFVAQNYGASTTFDGYNRSVNWSLRRGVGAQSLYYRAIFRETDHQTNFLKKPPKLNIIKLEENKHTAVDSIIEHARQASADIQTFAQAAVKELNKQDGNAKLLVGQTYNDANLVLAAITVLNQAKIYALPVEGFYLSQQKPNMKSLIAVYNDKEWLFINPSTAEIGLPKAFLVWQYGNNPLFNLSGGKKPRFSLTASATPINALSVAKTHGLQTNSQLLRFSLLQLPVNVQETYKILLTVPIGAFIILLLRNFIGLKTFGTFMPVLIALAFRETHVIWGIILFTTIISFGLLARFYLDQLRLLLVPRLAAILTVVILLMILISIVSHNLGLEAGLSVALFPMVILTMIIERMCVTWDERGPLEAIKSGVGSLIAALCAFAAMNYQPIPYLIFAFPELLLVLLAIILLFGQYHGYRLTELFRFNALTKGK